jgi:hypothetical protein
MQRRGGRRCERRGACLRRRNLQALDQVTKGQFARSREIDMLEASQAVRNFAGTIQHRND